MIRLTVDRVNLSVCCTNQMYLPIMISQNQQVAPAPAMMQSQNQPLFDGLGLMAELNGATLLHFPSRYIVVLYFCLALLLSLPATFISLMQQSDTLNTIGLWPTLSNCISLVFYSSIVLCTSQAASKTVYFWFEGQCGNDVLY